MRDRIGMGGIAEAKTFANFNAKAQPTAYETMTAYLDEPRTVVLGGPNGTGKTHLAMALGNAIIERDGLYPGWVPVLFRSFQDMLFRVRATYSPSYEGMGLGYYLARWRSVPLLIMDDVGPAGLDQSPSEHTRMIGYMVVDARYRAGDKPMVITTNKDPDDLGDWLTKSAVSRLFELGSWVEMRPGDWRLKRR